MSIEIEVVAAGPPGPKGNTGDTGDTGPKGDKGDKGDTGDLANLDIGTVTTGSPAAAHIDGNFEDGYELDLTLPSVGAGSIHNEDINAAANIAATKIAGAPKVVASQPAENDTVIAVDVTPKTTGFAPLGLDMVSGENQGDGAGTYNHAAFLGFNTGRHSGRTVVNAAPASFIGIEDNFFDHAVGGDGEFGGEFYWEVHPKSADDTFRPFYARASVSTDGTTVRRAAVIADLGSSGEGQFTVREQNGTVFTPLFNVTRTMIVASTAMQVKDTLEVWKGSGAAAYLVVDGGTAANIDFRIGGVSKTWFSASSSQFDIGSGSEYLATLTPAGTPATSLADLKSKVKAQGGLWAGSGTATPTATPTAALGASPPTITVAGNKTRGSVTFGTGGVSGLGNGGLMTIALGDTYAGEAINVVLTAANAATAALGLYVFPMYNAFAICVLNTPAADQANTTYAVNYQVIG